MTKERNFYIVGMKKIIFIIGLLSTALNFAQVKVSGHVVDVEGQPIPFADIIFKGSTIGTVSDEDGKFYLEAKKSHKTLVVSFIGFEKKEVLLKARNFNLRITLKEEAA